MEKKIRGTFSVGMRDEVKGHRIKGKGLQSDNWRSVDEHGVVKILNDKFSFNADVMVWFFFSERSLKKNVEEVS